MTTTIKPEYNRRGQNSNWRKEKELHPNDRYECESEYKNRLEKFNYILLQIELQHFYVILDIWTMESHIHIPIFSFLLLLVLLFLLAARHLFAELEHPFVVYSPRLCQH